MTLLVTSILAESVTDLATRAGQAWAGGADAVEVRMDAFDGDPSALGDYLKAHREHRWIITCRNAEEGGGFRGDTMERVSRLLAAARGTDAYVDFELADWRRSDNIRQKVGLAAAASDGDARRLILSAHDFRRFPENLDAVVHEIIDAHDAVAKVAYRGADIVDSFVALDLMHERGSSVIAISMGDEGLWTRLLARKLNAFASFCSLASDETTAPGQITLEEMIALYRWKSIDSSTKVYGVIGDPVAHSMSPLLFNHWFAAAGINAVYLPLRVGAEGDGLARFLNGCVERPWLDIGGFSVTIPHKASAWLKDGADSLSRRIGAVNTIAFHGAKPTGYNTDCYAAVSSLCDALQCERSNLAGLIVDVLGAGGSARAIVEGLNEFGCRVTAYGRSTLKTKKLADECGVAAAAWEDRVNRRGEVLINCTPLGMWPNVNESPMNTDSLRGCRLVFDLIYNPLQTRLLRDAAAAGCATLNGLDMFIRQAAMQFELWTGKVPEVHAARDLLTRETSRAAGFSPRGEKGKTSLSCVALIGLRGSGKTTVGRELAALLGGALVDTDELIAERAGRSIAETFQTEGEAGFRKREAAAISEVVQSSPSVISVGGGAVLDQQNVDALRTVASLIWLTAPPEVLYQRISSDRATPTSRPALTDKSGIEEVRRLLAERTPFYSRAADFQVDTAGREPKEIAEEIVNRLRPPSPQARG